MAAAPSERVARLRFWIKLKKAGANVADAALGEVEKGFPAISHACAD